MIYRKKSMLSLALSITACLVCASQAFADNVVSDNAKVTSEIKHDTLPSLRGTVSGQGSELSQGTAHPARPLPLTPKEVADGAIQSSTTGLQAPTFGVGFDGVGNGFTGPQGTFTVNSAPPDTNGAVGATQYLQIVNSAFGVWSKSTGSIVYGPVSTNSLWKGFGGGCETNNDGDAVVVYDKTAGRWVVSQFSVSTTPYLQCVAVSATSDATGAWHRYAFTYSNFPDYPKMGVWPDAYYTTFNMFNGNSFAGAQLCAYDRNAMLNGQTATQQCFQLSSSYGGVLPADLDGSTAPPAGSPNYLMNFGSNSLNLWKFHVDWTTPANTKLTGPINVPVAAFSEACGGGVCVPQSGTHQQLDSLADRLMFRLAYRNFGTYESLVVSHSVQVGARKTNPYTGVRWYEIRNPANSAPTVYQQSTYSPDSNYRWMSSVAMDKQGNMALGYSVSSSTMFPAVRYTGRLISDPLNTMQAETSIVAGTGAQSGQNLSRWGDYSAMSIDPVDDCTFWYTNEYLKSTGAFNWNTRIASFKFTGCQ